MWKLVFGSVTGTSHIRSGQPCQDSCAGSVAGSTLFVACADGAGSAEYSQLGSRAAVEFFMEIAASLKSAPTREQIEAWVDGARACVLEIATINDTTPRQLACTFLAAIIGENWAAFIQIGDGAIVFDGTEGYELAFWPDNGEYANTTRFLTEDEYRANLRIEIIERHVTELAILTDGLQMLALDFSQSKAHDPFFAPLFRTVKNGPDEEVLRSALLDFMDSNRVNERTDDDKSLLLATRISADVPPNSSEATA